MPETLRLKPLCSEPDGPVLLVPVGILLSISTGWTDATAAEIGAAFFE